MARFNRLALICALCSVSAALPVVAQPDALAAEEWDSIRVDVLPFPKGATAEKQESHLRVQLRNADVKEALKIIALRGDLQLVIRKGVDQRVRFQTLNRVSPTIALQAVCRATGLECELRNGVWFVSPGNKGLSTPHGQLRSFTMRFEDFPLRDIFDLIARNYAIKIRVEPDVQGKIAYLDISTKTPRQAVELVARVANLDLHDENGTIVVSTKPAPDNAAPETEPEENVAKLHLL